MGRALQGSSIEAYTCSCIHRDQEEGTSKE